MPVLAFPGPAAPPPPAVTLEIPEGWEALPAGTGLLRARGTGGAGDPIEVGVGAHAVASGTRADELVEAVASAGAPEVVEAEPVFVVEIGGREWAARNLTWDEPDGVVVEVVLATAATAATAADGDAASRFVVATGRVRGRGLEGDYDLLQSVLETLTVEAGG